MSADLSTAVRSVVQARRAFVAAEKARKAAELAFIAAAEAEGIEVVDLPEGLRVAIEHRPRRSLDAEVVREYVGLQVLREVLREVVDTKAFDAAVATGQIAAEVADKATTVAYSTQVRVYGDAVVGERA
jgi:hypothetical protein